MYSNPAVYSLLGSSFSFSPWPFSFPFHQFGNVIGDNCMAPRVLSLPNSFLPFNKWWTASQQWCLLSAHRGWHTFLSPAELKVDFIDHKYIQGELHLWHYYIYKYVRITFGLLFFCIFIVLPSFLCNLASFLYTSVLCILCPVSFFYLILSSFCLSNYIRIYINLPVSVMTVVKIDLLREKLWVNI